MMAGPPNWGMSLALGAVAMGIKKLGGFGIPGAVKHDPLGCSTDPVSSPALTPLPGLCGLSESTRSGAHKIMAGTPLMNTCG